jgi:hypothetical protein
MVVRVASGGAHPRREARSQGIRALAHRSDDVARVPMAESMHALVSGGRAVA